MFTARCELRLSFPLQLGKTIFPLSLSTQKTAISAVGSDRYTIWDHYCPNDALLQITARTPAAVNPSHLFIVYVATLLAQRTGKIVGDNLAGMWKEAAIV